MKPDEGYLDLNQNKRYYYPRRRGKRCWKCKSWDHIKRNYPQIKFFSMGARATPKRDVSREISNGNQGNQKIKRGPGAKARDAKTKKETKTDAL